VEFKLELVPVPVADVDRAKAFYADTLGFVVDHDHRAGGGRRIVQLTPPGSACSIMLSTGVPEVSELVPGASRGLHLVVADIDAARALLASRGIELTDVEDVGDGVQISSFADPDGNTMILQQVPWRAGDAY
jgi:catechol 2,3-dioxygenase-like lactoylglutathione lyase family enzyme